MEVKVNRTKLVRDVIVDFLQDKKPFTGVNISAAVKQTDSKIRHSKHVKPVLDAMWRDSVIQGFSYTRTLIDVEASIKGKLEHRKAFLYHHTDFDPQDFDERDIKLPAPPQIGRYGIISAFVSDDNQDESEGEESDEN